MYEPLHLPAIRRKPRKNTQVNNSVNMDMTAIRARRARLEALTVAMRAAPLEQAPIRPARYSASKIRRPPTEHEHSASRSIRLQPLSRTGSECELNELDTRRNKDPLLRTDSTHIDDTPRPGTADGSGKGAMAPSDTILEAEAPEDGAPPRKASLAIVEGRATRRNSGAVPELSPRRSSDLGDEDSNLDPELQTILQQLRSPDEDVQLKGATAARQNLSEEVNPPLDSYIGAGILPILLNLLGKDHQTELQFESLWSLTNIAAGKFEHTLAIIDADGIPPIERLLASPEEKVALQALWAISNIVGDSAITRDRVIEAGVLPSLAAIVGKHDSVEAQRIIAWTFSNLLRFKPNIMTDEQRLTSLHALKHYISVDDESAQVDAARGIEFASDGDNSNIQQVLDLGVLQEILSFLEIEDYRLVQVAVKIVGNIVSGDDSQTEEVVNAGAVPLLVTLLRDDEEAVRKEAAWALSNILAGTPQQVQTALDANALPTLLYLMEEESTSLRVAKEVCWCLSNICNGGSDHAVDELVREGGVPAMLGCLKRHKNTPITGLILSACSDVLKRTNCTDELRQTLDRKETETLLEDLVSDGDEVATELWTDFKTKVFNKS